MAQKFILTDKGFFRLGDVRLHKDLLLKGDVCYGGGFYRFDYGSGRLVLEGESYDFGRPRWEWLMDGETVLKVPSAYRGLLMVYHPEEWGTDDFVVSHEMKIEYI